LHRFKLNYFDLVIETSILKKSKALLKKGMNLSLENFPTWIIGVVSLFLTIIGMDRWIAKKITDGDTENSTKINSLDEKLTKKIDCDRRELSDKISSTTHNANERIDRQSADFVRRDEMKILFDSVLHAINQSREEQRGTNARLDKFLESQFLTKS
jgi:hypothetical protein